MNLKEIVKRMSKKEREEEIIKVDMAILNILSELSDKKE